MNFEAFRRATPQEFFDYSWIAEALKDLKKPRDCISALIADHKILRLKRGLYVFGELWRRAPLYEEMLANLLYGPSCVSFEYALAQYGMIAERPSVITSLTIGDSKTFHTPLGIFEYRAITSKKFKVGIEYKDLGDMGGYFIASKEKALADLVYRTSRIRNIEQLRHYLFEEMRIDESAFQALDKKKLEEIAKAYQKNSIHMISKL